MERKEAYMRMKRHLIIMLIIGMAVMLTTSTAFASGRQKLSPDTPKSEIMNMHPRDIDPSLLPLDSIEDLHTTGTPQQVNIGTWALQVKGAKVKYPQSLRYEDLKAMEMVKKKVILICPGVFVDYAEWEGVRLSTILEKVGIEGGYKTITFHGLDGYSSRFSREDVEAHLLILALKVNGKTLPKEHGFPVRLVAEDILGGKWVKWVSTIEVK
jgi:DMSO/TMAO reductase YedYZ molybdopterin-dependent catalytic subunit